MGPIDITDRDDLGPRVAYDRSEVLPAAPTDADAPDRNAFARRHRAPSAEDGRGDDERGCQGSS